MAVNSKNVNPGRLWRYHIQLHIRRYLEVLLLECLFVFIREIHAILNGPMQIQSVAFFVSGVLNFVCVRSFSDM